MGGPQSPLNKRDILPPCVIPTLGEHLRRSMAVPLLKSRQGPLQNVHKFQRTKKCNEFLPAYYYLLGNIGAGPFSRVGEGSSLNFASQQGGGGACFNCSNKIIKKFPGSLHFYELNSCLRPLNFSVCKIYSVLVVLLLQLLSCWF